MNLKELPAKRTVKLLALVLTSLLIASVSAAVYYSMSSDITVTIDTAMVTFTAGDDSTAAGASYGTNNTYCMLASLKAYPNATLTYDEAVNLTNNEAETTQVQLSYVSITPDDADPSVSNFTSITFYLMDETGAQQDSWVFTTTGDTWNEPADSGYNTMDANDVWSIKVEIVAVAGANPGITTAIVIEVDVQD